MESLAEIPEQSAPRPKGFPLKKGLFLAAIAFHLFLSPAQAKEKEATLQDGWDYAARLLANDGYTTFNQITVPPGGNQRLVDYGKAATLISVQPKTSGNIEKASALLENIIQSEPSDDLSFCARYLLGRIAQIHMLTPDETLALKRFDELIALNPTHPLSQAAMTKRAMVRIYALSDEPPLEIRYQQALKEAPEVTEPGARRDYMLLLAATSIRLNKPPGLTLDHLLQAEKCDNFRKRALSDLYVRIAEFSIAAGKKDQAIAYYEKFLATFIRDNRRFIIKEKLSALKPQETKR